MKRTGIFRFGALVVGLVAVSAQASAYEAADHLDEIVVTAQRQSENLQNVPIAVAAIPGDTMQSLGITQVSQLSSLTPSVQLIQNSAFGTPSGMMSAFVHGIGQSTVIRQPNLRSDIQYT